MGFFKSKEERQRAKEAKAKAATQEAIFKNTSNKLTPETYIDGRNEKQRNANEMKIVQSQEELRDQLREGVKAFMKSAQGFLQDDRTEEAIQELLQRIPQVPLGKDAGTTKILSKFFENQINEGLRYAQDKNVVGALFLATDLDGLLSEMMDRNSSSLFSNTAYVEARVRVSELASLKEGYEGDLIRLYKKRDDIKALLESGRITASQAQDRLEPIRDDVAAVKAKIQSTQDQLSTQSLSLREMRDQILNSAKAQEKDLAVNDEILEGKADNEARSNEYAAQRNKFRTNNRAVDDSRMQLNDSSSSQETELTEEKKKAMFDF